MGEVIKFSAKILLGAVAVTTGAVLIKNGIQNASNIKSFPTGGGGAR